MQQVIEKECGEAGAGPDHGLRGEGRLQMLGDRVVAGLGGIVLKSNQYGEIHMHRKDREHHAAKHPDDRSKAVELDAVRIDAVGTDEDRGVSEKMDRGEEDEDQAGCGHDQLLADRTA
jgi:hypothetical protein